MLCFWRCVVYRTGVTDASLAQGDSASVQSALSQGADIVIQSTHKVLGSMGQSSMLHAQGALVDRARISRALQTLQVSAPTPPWPYVELHCRADLL
jgi:arginine/lysine/ornithine decarboxylase